jgi:HEAT repeat protein
VLLKLCKLGFNGEDITVKLTAIVNMERLEKTPKAQEALEILLQAAEDGNALIRAGAAKSLWHFDSPQVREVLTQLRQDSDYRVVGAVLERLL